MVESMKKSVIVIILMLLAISMVSCSKKEEKNGLVGTWGRSTGEEDTNQAACFYFQDKIMGGTTSISCNDYLIIEFYNDGSFVFTGDNKIEGTYKLVQDGKAVILSQSDGRESDSMNFTISENRLTFKDKNKHVSGYVRMK